MAKFLFTELISNDLGLPTRTVPIAVELVRRGHEVAFCNPAEAPRKLIDEAGLRNLATRPRPIPTVFPKPTPEIWNIDHFWAAAGYQDENYVRSDCEGMMSLMTDYGADFIVDSWNISACLAARALGKPLVTVLQADMHPDSRGFIWWKEPKVDIPTPVPVLNKVLADHGLKPIDKAAELHAGDLTLIVGISETDPLPEKADVTYIGPVLWQRPEVQLPDWISELSKEKPVVWIYTGNPRYMPGRPIWGDSIVVLHACIEALSDEDVQVVLTTGHHALPEEASHLPANFHYQSYVPGLALAGRSDLLIHHGGHGSCLTGPYTGTPAVIIPTYSERESNARRIATIGAGEFVVPTEDVSGEKHVSAEKVRMKVKQVLSAPSYTENARRIGEKMRAYGGAFEAARLIDDFVAR